MEAAHERLHRLGDDGTREEGDDDEQARPPTAEQAQADERQHRDDGQDPHRAGIGDDAEDGDEPGGLLLDVGDAEGRAEVERFDVFHAVSLCGNAASGVTSAPQSA